MKDNKEIKDFMSKSMTVAVLIFIIANTVYGQEVPQGYLVQGNECPEVVIPKGWEEQYTKTAKYYLPSEENRARGYILFKKNYLDLIHPGSIPSSSEIDDILETFVSLGEYEPLTFSVRALDDLKEVKVTVGDLVSENGGLIKKENIDVRIVRYFPVISKDKEKKYTLEPLILEKRDFVDIFRNTTRQYWLTIYIPPYARAGDYTSRVVFKPKNKIEKELKLKVKVLPINLKEPSRIYGIYYSGDTRWKGFYPENIRKHFIDIKEHGLRTITIYSVPEIKKVGDDVKLDFLKPGVPSPWSVEEMMRNYIEVGLTGPVIFTGLDYIIRFNIKSIFGHQMYTKEFDSAYKQIVRMIKLYVENKNWPEFFFSPSDEPATSTEKMRLTKHYLRLTKEIAPELKTFVTLFGGWKEIDDGGILNPWLDIRCYDWLDEKLIQDTRMAKKQLWVYNGGSFGKKPVVDRFFYGFYSIKISADGIMQWTYQWPSSAAIDPYHELETGAQGWYYTYPSPEGPLPTIGWEGIREGIDDARYVATLEYLITKAEETGDLLLIARAKKARKTLTTILNNIDINSQTEKRYLISKQISETSSIFDKWRWQIACDIMELKKLLGTK